MPRSTTRCSTASPASPAPSTCAAATRRAGAGWPTAATGALRRSCSHASPTTTRCCLEYDTPARRRFQPAHARAPGYHRGAGPHHHQGRASWRPGNRRDAHPRRPPASSPLERLALSPQCGFASGEYATTMTHAEQEAKLRLVGTASPARCGPTADTRLRFIRAIHSQCGHHVRHAPRSQLAKAGAAIAALVAVFAADVAQAQPQASAQSFKDCADCPEMVVVPAGRFAMGSPPEEPGRAADREDQVQVTIAQPFAVGAFAVTRGEYAAFVAATRHAPTAAATSGPEHTWVEEADRSWRSVNFPQDDRHPSPASASPMPRPTWPGCRRRPARPTACSRKPSANT